MEPRRITVDLSSEVRGRSEACLSCCLNASRRVLTSPILRPDRVPSGADRAQGRGQGAHEVRRLTCKHFPHSDVVWSVHRRWQGSRGQRHCLAFFSHPHPPPLFPASELLKKCQWAEAPAAERRGSQGAARIGLDLWFVCPRRRSHFGCGFQWAHYDHSDTMGSKATWKHTAVVDQHDSMSSSCDL